jgi:hypothetical protein
MDLRTPVHAITHVHTAASSGPASDMDAMIGGAIRDVLGPDTPVRWGECFTPVAQLAALLHDDAADPAVGLITLTDHVTPEHHAIPEDALRAAAADPRLAVGAEVWCVERDVDGTYRKAPEVLIYGRPEPVSGPFGSHYGLSQELLDELFLDCRVPGRPEVQTSKVLAFCGRHGLACALAHPFDGHALSLEGTLDLISRGRLVETVNGGFPEASTRVLEDLIAFQNRVVSGWRMGPTEALRYPAARRLAERIVDEGRSFLHPWGGSDAHIRNFSRVTMRFLSDGPEPTAGDLFRAMLDRTVASLLLDGTFQICGEPGSALSVVDDIVRIVLKNVWWNGRKFGGPLAFAAMLARTRNIVAAELARRAKRQAELHRAVARDFPFARLLPSLRSDTRRAARRRSFLPLAGVE